MSRKKQKTPLAARKAEWVAARRALLAHELSFVIGFLSDAGYKKRLAHVVWLCVFCAVTGLALSFRVGDGLFRGEPLSVCKLVVLLVASSSLIAIVISLLSKALARRRAIAQLKAELGKEQLAFSLENGLLFLRQEEWIAMFRDLFARRHRAREAFELSQLVEPKNPKPLLRLSLLVLARVAPHQDATAASRSAPRGDSSQDCGMEPGMEPNSGKSSAQNRSRGPRRL